MGSPETLKGVALNGVDGWEILNPSKEWAGKELMPKRSGWVGN